MEQIKLVATDLDNTLLNGEKQISEHTRDTIETAIANGVCVVPATGRTFQSVPKFLTQIPGLRYAICCNGATVYDYKTEKVVATNHFSSEVVLKILKIVEKNHCTKDIYQNGRGYMEAKYYNNLAKYHVEGPLFQLIKETRTVVDNLEEYIKENPNGIEKINLFFYDMDEREAVKQELLELGLSSVVSALGNNLELSAYGCDKSVGLELLAKHLSIPMESVMACGDANNDTQMVEVAGIGVAVENAYDEVKEVANFISKSNEEDGVAFAIEKFAL